MTSKIDTFTLAAERGKKKEQNGYDVVGHWLCCLWCFITNLCELSRQLLNDVVAHRYILIQRFLIPFVRSIEDVVGMFWLSTHCIFYASHLEVPEPYFASGGF